jgi:hypothetical protein
MVFLEPRWFASDFDGHASRMNLASLDCANECATDGILVFEPESPLPFKRSASLDLNCNEFYDDKVRAVEDCF